MFVNESERKVEELSRGQAADLFVIALAMLNDRSAARESLIQTIAKAFLRSRRQKPGIDSAWLRRQALASSRSLARDSIFGRGMSEPKTEIDSRLVQMVNVLDRTERVSCVLHYGGNWSDSEIAYLLGVNEESISRLGDIFRQKISNALHDLQLKDPEFQAGAVIREHFSAPDWTPADLDELLAEARKLAIELEKSRTSRRSHWIGISAFTIGVLLMSVLGAALFSRLQLSWGGIPVFQSLLPKSQATRQSPESCTKPLTWMSRSDEIKTILREGSTRWKSLWIEIQRIDYGPDKYIGAPRIYLLQAWVSQPDQSIELFGLLSSDPSGVYFVTEDHSFHLNPMIGLAESRIIQASPETLIYDKQLRQMVFPELSNWITKQGLFRVQDTAGMLGREAIVADWYNAYGQREARLWIDTNTGVILRLQEYGGDNFQLLIADSIATDLIFNQGFPPARLAAAMRQVSSLSEDDDSSEIQIILPTPTAALPIENRGSIPVQPKSAKDSPANSVLVFQFANNLETSNIQTNTSQVAVHLYADAHRIGETTFGLPWMLRCDRSPDGYRIAFNTGSDGASLPDDSLRWLDLQQPAKIYQPIPDLRAKSFAFSPNNLQLAVFATGETKDQSGVYLIDLLSAENRKLISLPDATSLVWSPDGELLALISELDPEGGALFLVIHVRTGQITFQAELPADFDVIPSDWPISNWGIPFPQSMGGLADCAVPTR